MVQPVNLTPFKSVKTFADFQRESDEFEEKKRQRLAEQELKRQKFEYEKQMLQSGAKLPAAIQEWNAYNALSKDDQTRYLQMKRADKILDMGGGFRRFNPITGAAESVGSGDKSPNPKQQWDIDLQTREAQDKYNRGLDVKKKTLAAVERLIGTPDYTKDPSGEIFNEDNANISGVRANRGGLSSWLPNFSNSSVDAAADLETITNLLTTENLGLLKGVLSDTDMRVLQSIGSGDVMGSDKKVLAALRRMYKALSGQVSNMQQYVGQDGLPPLPSAMNPASAATRSNQGINNLDDLLNAYTEEQGDYSPPAPLPPLVPLRDSKIPIKAVRALRADPTLSEEFDQKYGYGASKLVFGGK